MSDCAREAAPLGRGLAALFGEAGARVAADPASRRRDLPIEAIRPVAVAAAPAFCRGRARRRWRSRSAKRASCSRCWCGRSPTDAADFELVAGERRWRAAQRVGLHEVPVIVRALGDCRGDRDRAGRKPPARGPVAARRGRGLQPADRRVRANPGEPRRGRRQKPQPCRQHHALAVAAGAGAPAARGRDSRPAMREPCSPLPTRRCWPTRWCAAGSMCVPPSGWCSAAHSCRGRLAAGPRCRHAGARTRPRRPARAARHARAESARRRPDPALCEPRPARPGLAPAARPIRSVNQPASPFNAVARDCGAGALLRLRIEPGELGTWPQRLAIVRIVMPGASARRSVSASSTSDAGGSPTINQTTRQPSPASFRTLVKSRGIASTKHRLGTRAKVSGSTSRSWTTASAAARAASAGHDSSPGRSGFGADQEHQTRVCSDHGRNALRWAHRVAPR